MNCVVTGGCGFIGSHLVDHLVSLGHDVTIVDDFSTGKSGNRNEKATLVQGSILDSSLVRSAVAGANWVFHTAAWARVQRSIDDPVGTHGVNVTGTLTVLHASAEAGVDRVVYSSSSSVYGDQDTHLMAEHMSEQPKSPYALQKLMGEQYATMFARMSETRFASLRYFNVYGPRQVTEGNYALVIGQFLRQRDAGDALTVYGDGTQTRSYTYVDDVVRANILAAESDLTAGENTIMNIGTSRETTVNEIAKMIGGDVRHLIPNPRGDFEESRKAADYTKAKSVLGWEPEVPVEAGLKTVR